MKRKSGMLTIISLILVTLIGLSITARSQSYVLEWRDPADDLRAFTSEQMKDMFGDTEPEDVPEVIKENWKKGARVSEPNCIDMIKITLTREDPVMILTIEMEGDIEACETPIFILIWGNCSCECPDGEDFMFLGLIVISDEDFEMGGNVSGTVGYMFQTTDGDSADGVPDIDGSTVEVEFPSEWWNDDCALYILSGTVVGEGEDQMLYADIFPNTFVGERGAGGDYDTGVGGLAQDTADSMANFISIITVWIHANLFWIMLILFMVILFIVGYYLKRHEMNRDQKIKWFVILLIGILLVIILRDYLTTSFVLP